MVSKAPPPITPLRGSFSRSSRPTTANWSKWQHIPHCRLWEAVCLTLDIEPGDTLGDWVRNHRGVPHGFPTELTDRIQIAKANVNTQGPIHPQHEFVDSTFVPVLLREVAAAGLSWDWVMPEAMKTLALSAVPEPQTVPAKNAANAKQSDTQTRFLELARTRLENRPLDYAALCDEFKSATGGATWTVRFAMLQLQQTFQSGGRDLALMALVDEWINEHPLIHFEPLPAKSTAPVVAGASDGEEWQEKARARAIEIIKRQREKDLYPNQISIADEIAREFRATHIVGVDGKPLSGATIKRHALKGISSAQGKQLSTTISRGK